MTMDDETREAQNLTARDLTHMLYHGEPADEKRPQTWTHVYICDDPEHPDLKKWGAGSARMLAHDSVLSPEAARERAAAIATMTHMFRYVASFDHEPTEEELEALEE